MRLIDHFRSNAIYILGFTLKARILDSHNKSQISEKFSASKINNFGRWYNIIRNNYPSIFSDLKKRYAQSGFLLANFASTTADDNQEVKECADVKPIQNNSNRKSKKKCKKTKHKKML